MSEPIVENSLWQKAVALNPELRDAVMNPNTDFMTKLLFDARFLAKKSNKELTYWSNLIFKLKWLLREKKALSKQQIAKELKVSDLELDEILKYLSGLAEVKEEKGKFSLNYLNPFSKPFQT